MGVLIDKSKRNEKLLFVPLVALYFKRIVPNHDSPMGGDGDNVFSRGAVATFGNGAASGLALCH